MISEERVIQVIGALVASDRHGEPLRRQAMELLGDLPGYDWSGIYRLEGEELVLDEYAGAPTDHTRIPVGRGVCGTAVKQGRNQVVGDVRRLSNYLSCSLLTRSEIVVLIRKDGQTLGQIDIDGHEIDAFDHSDERFLERVAAILAERWSDN